MKKITEKEIEKLGFSVDFYGITAFRYFHKKDVPTHLHWECVYYFRTNTLSFEGWEYGKLTLRNCKYVHQIKSALKLFGIKN